MSRRWLVALLGFLLVLLFSRLIFEVAKETIVLPIWQSVVVARALIESWNQRTLWILMLLIAASIALGNLFRFRRFQSAPDPLEVQTYQRVETLARWIEMLPGSDYFKWRMARYLGELSVEVLAHTRTSPPGLVREWIRSGEVEAQPEIHTYLQLGLTPGSQTMSLRQGRGRRSLGPARALDLDPRRLVAFLEGELGTTAGEPDRQGESRDAV